MANPYQDYLNRNRRYWYGGMNIPDLSQYGALPTSEASSYYGGLPGDSEDETGLVGMVSYGIKEGLGGPLVGLAERIGAMPEGSRQRLREEFEAARLEYLSGNPGPWRTFVAGASEILPGVVPYLPAAGVGAAAAKFGVSASAAARGAAIAEGALVGFGESVGSDAKTSIGATIAGAALGSFGGGAGAKFQLNRADKEVGAIGKFLDTYLSIDKGLPSETVDIKQRAIGTIKDEQAKAATAIGRLQKIVGADSELELRVNAALNGEIPMRDLPDTVRPIAEEMRGHIDRLSDEILASDMAPDSLKEIIARNKGKYTHLSHEAFDNKQYKDFILGTDKGQDKWNNAFDYLRRENPDWSAEETYGYMMQLIDREAPPIKYAGAGEVKKPEGRIFQHRDNIADPIRELMGVYKDPATNYLKSISFMASDLAYHKAIQEMRPVLLGAGLAREGVRVNGRWMAPDANYYVGLKSFVGREPFTKPGPLADRSLNIIGVGDKVKLQNQPYGKQLYEVTRIDSRAKKVTINMNGDNRTYPLARIRGRKGETVYLPGARRLQRSVETDSGVPPLFGTVESAEILNATRDTANMTVLPMVNLMTHVAKTVLSPQTHARNFLSGLLMITLQGHNPLSLGALREAGAAAFRYGRKGLDIDSTEAKEIADLLRRNNILGAGPKADLERYKELVEMRLDAGPFTKARRKLYEKLKFFGDTAGGWYQAEDDFWKVYNFKKERARYVKAGLSADEATARSLKMTRDHMQNYSLIPEGVKKIRDFPLVGPFVSFPSEIVRNIKNSMKNALLEMADDNPAIRKIGAQRLGGIIATTVVIPSALSQVGKFLTNTSDEELQAMREFMAPYTENSQVIPLTKAPGKTTYIDFSFMDPYNYVKKPVLAVLNGMAREGVGGFEALWEGAKEAVEPWIGPEIAVGELLNLSRTLEARSEAPAGYIAKAVAHRAYRTFAPGAVLTGERILRGANIPGVRDVLPKYSRFGREYKLAPEALAVVGPRLTSLDFQESFKYRATDFTRAKSQAGSIFREEARSVDRGPLKKIAAKESALATYTPAAEVLLRKIDAARKLGVTDQQMFSILADLNISKADARMLLAGRIPPLRLKESSL